MINIEIFSWFGIDNTSLTQSKMKLPVIIPSLRDVKFGDLVGNPRRIGVMLKDMTLWRRHILSADKSLEVIPLHEVFENETQVDIEVQPMSFKDAVEAYIIKLSVPKESPKEMEIKDPRVLTTFSYNERQCAYIRTAEEIAKGRHDLTRSAYSVRSSSLAHSGGVCLRFA